MLLRGRTMFDPCLGDADTHAPHMCQFPYLRAKVPSTVKTKDICLFAFSFAKSGAKEKAIKKKTPKEDFALCGARQGRLALDPAAF